MTYAAQASFGVYDPAAIGWATADPERDSSLLVPFSHSGVSFGPMNRYAVPVFKAVLDELVPQIPSKRLVAGQCGCYNPGSLTVGGSRSFHTYAIAIDINWGSNPMYAASKPSLPDSLPAITSAIAQKYGCEWGGDWSYPQDWMHIEIHLTPAEAAAVTPIASAPPAQTLEEFLMAVKATQDQWNLVVQAANVTARSLTISKIQTGYNNGVIAARNTALLLTGQQAATAASKTRADALAAAVAKLLAPETAK
ncbi:M15 family metallopeptidase [Jatrophihabitans sp. DSM 45814]